MLFREHRDRARGLADLMLYDALVDDGILLLQDGSLLSAWKYRGPDMDSATSEQMAALCARLNSVLKLGGGWMIQADAIRTSAPEYPEVSHFPQSVAMLIDVERRQQFSHTGQHFETEYVLTVTYQPPRLREERFRSFLFGDGAVGPSGIAARALDYFRGRVRAVEGVLGALFYIDRLNAEVRVDDAGFRVVDDQLLRFVRRCVTGIDHPFELPEVPACLSDIISSVDVVGGYTPRIGTKHLRVVAIDGFPMASRPGVLRALDALPLEYRWNTRALLLDPEEARTLIDAQRKRWTSQVRGMADQIMGTQRGAVNRFAQEMANDAEDAMGLATAQDVQFCYYTSVVLVLADSEAQAETNAAQVAKCIRGLGYTARVEEVNAMDAFIGSLPGDGYANLRRYMLHTMNLAHFLPTTAVWAGERVNPSPLMPPASPPLMYAATTGATPFRLSFHVGDVGHTIVVGPPGTGKSTFLAFAAAQWFRYPGAQVFAFDKGRSLEVLTAALGGDFYDVGGESGELSFQPLRELDSPGDIAWAVDWCEWLANLQDKRLTPGERNALTDGVVALSRADAAHRTLTELSANVQNTELRDVLSHYSLGGAVGHLLDAEADALRTGRFVTFEMEELLHSSEKAVVPVLLYLFRQLEKRLTGVPTLVLIDEAWVFLRHPLFRERLRAWLKTMRKSNATVVLSTQQLSDVVDSPIRDVILESCLTRVLCPNSEAGTTGSSTFYELIGLNAREVETVRTAIPKREYYIVSPMGRRKVALGLNGVAMAFVGVSGREERERALGFASKYGEGWVPAWLRARHLPDWAAFYEAGMRAVDSEAARRVG